MAYLAMSSPGVFASAVRAGVTISYTASATRGGVTVASGLRPVGGNITDTTKPGVRRILSMDVVGDTALYNSLTPYGTTVSVTAHVRFTNRTTVDVPMGVFDVDDEALSVGDGRLSFTAPDKWVRIQRARFLGPSASTKGRAVVDELTAMIRGALGASEPVTVSATTDATVPALVYERDRAKAIIDLAETAGVWVYFDRLGVATIADVPQIGASADWLVDASASGVLISLDRQRSRRDVSNVVVVESSAADGSKFATQYVWDNDPASPTFAATGNGAGSTPPSPGTGGPLGLVPYFHDTPVLTTGPQARRAGQTILARTTGMASSVSLSTVTNPAVDAFDALDVLPPGREVSGVTVAASEGFGTGPFGTMPFGQGSGVQKLTVHYRSTQVLERHFVDTVTHPLSVGQPLQIEGRSTRTDTYVSGV